MELLESFKWGEGFAFDFFFFFLKRTLASVWEVDGKGAIF